MKAVQELPYVWPAEPTADDVRRHGRGTCAGKHALLREELQSRGFTAGRLMVVGPLVPALWPDLADEGRSLLEVHECLTVETDWAGPLIVDVTWHPAAIEAGLPGTLDWDGISDMVCAVEPVRSYVVADARFREQKELLRSRLYTDQERRVRDRLLAQIATRAGRLGTSTSPPSPRSIAE